MFTPLGNKIVSFFFYESELGLFSSHYKRLFNKANYAKKRLPIEMFKAQRD